MGDPPGPTLPDEHQSPSVSRGFIAQVKRDDRRRAEDIDPEIDGVDGQIGRPLEAIRKVTEDGLERGHDGVPSLNPRRKVRQRVEHGRVLSPRLREPLPIQIVEGPEEALHGLYNRDRVGTAPAVRSRS